jgi:hypothetical protein
MCWIVFPLTYLANFYLIWKQVKTVPTQREKNSFLLKFLILLQYANLIFNIFFPLNLFWNLLCNHIFFFDYQTVLNDKWKVTEKFTQKYKHVPFFSRLSLLLMFHHLSYLLIGGNVYVNIWILILWFSHLRFLIDEQTSFVIAIFIDAGNVLQLIPFGFFLFYFQLTFSNLAILVYMILFIILIRKPVLSWKKLRGESYMTKG